MSAYPASTFAPSRAATQEAKALNQVFQAITLDSCPKVYNFHMHTCCSDGKLTPEELMSQATDLGLAGLAITDHHNIRGYLKARRWMEDWRWRNPSAWRSVSPGGKQSGANQPRRQLPRLWIGIEINATLLDREVHILGYAFNPKHVALEPYLRGCASDPGDRKATNVIQSIQKAGGMAILAHPARYRLPLEALIGQAAELGIDGVETYYAYDNPAEWRPSPGQTEQIKALADHHQLLSTCGTDTHGRTLTRRL